MKHHSRAVYGGVDTHQQVHVAAVIDEVGTLLGTRSFATTTLGLRSLQRWLARHGRVVAVGVEGTGSYGLGLQRVLQEAGVQVVEVNRPNRQLRRAKGKTDPVDAEAAARAVLAGHAQVVPKTHDGVVESIRVLLVAYNSTIQALQRTDGRLGSLLVTAPEVLRVQFAHLNADQRGLRAARLHSGDNADPLIATKTAMRVLGRQRVQLAADAKDLRTQLDTLTSQANPALRQVHGVGPVVAATLLTAAGDNPQRLRSEAAFAALCGASPIPACSGKTTRHRLNPGGHRQANSALHRIAVVRKAHHHQPTLDYIARRRSQGKNDKEIMRCLKRFIAREIYRHLQNPRPAVRTDDLRTRRQKLKQPLRVPAEALGTYINAISRLERGTSHDPELATRYRNWIQEQENTLKTA